MGFFKVSTKAEDVKDSGGSGFINQSGFYPVTLKNVMVNTNEKGARSIDFYLDCKGTLQAMYGAIKLDNNDGSPNFQADLFNKLCIVCGVEEVSEPVEGSLPIGKEKAEKDVMILEDLDDKEVILRVQMEYSLYNGEVKEKKIIKNVFRSSDNATASEIVNEAEVGAQYEKEQKYKDNITYKNGLTPEDVEAYLAGRGKGEKQSTTKMTTKPVTFGKKKFGN